MLYMTGATHGSLSQLSKCCAGLKKGDSLIICGDFGFIWDGSKKEKRILKYIGKKKINVFFTEGVHENFDELEIYPVETRYGGKVRVISGNLCQLLRGEVYIIEEKKILAFGGGFREDADFTAPDESVPTKEDIKNAELNLERYENQVDFIVSYEAPSKISEHLLGTLKRRGKDKGERTHLNAFFDVLDKRTKFTRWFFGFCHTNRAVTSKHYSLFDKKISADADFKK